MFQLHEQLRMDCIPLGRFPLSLLLFMNDSRFPWGILVPQRENLTELHQLSPQDRVQLMNESCHLGEVMARVFEARKMNVASMGNLVPQLHLHHIVRKPGDAAWPGPVWGTFPPVPYTEEELARLRADLLPRLSEGFQ